jgi:hypothetical protein
MGFKIRQWKIKLCRHFVNIYEDILKFISNEAYIAHVDSRSNLYLIQEKNLNFRSEKNVKI